MCPQNADVEQSRKTRALEEEIRQLTRRQEVKYFDLFSLFQVQNSPLMCQQNADTRALEEEIKQLTRRLEVRAVCFFQACARSQLTPQASTERRPAIQEGSSFGRREQAADEKPGGNSSCVLFSSFQHQNSPPTCPQTFDVEQSRKARALEEEIKQLTRRLEVKQKPCTILLHESLPCFLSQEHGQHEDLVQSMERREKALKMDNIRLEEMTQDLISRVQEIETALQVVLPFFCRNTLWHLTIPSVRLVCRMHGTKTPSFRPHCRKSGWRTPSSKPC